MPGSLDEPDVESVVKRASIARESVAVLRRRIVASSQQEQEGAPAVAVSGFRSLRIVDPCEDIDIDRLWLAIIEARRNAQFVVDIVVPKLARDANRTRNRDSPVKTGVNDLHQGRQADRRRNLSKSDRIRRELQVNRVLVVISEHSLALR